MVFVVGRGNNVLWLCNDSSFLNKLSSLCLPDHCFQKKTRSKGQGSFSDLMFARIMNIFETIISQNWDQQKVRYPAVRYKWNQNHIKCYILQEFLKCSKITDVILINVSIYLSLFHPSTQVHISMNVLWMIKWMDGWGKRDRSQIYHTILASSDFHLSIDSSLFHPSMNPSTHPSFHLFTCVFYPV